jgi:hypothetical protein
VEAVYAPRTTSPSAQFSRHAWHPMASLFRNRFSRPVAPRRRRPRASAPAMPFERLEERLALAGDTISRPILERAATVSLGATNVGPAPIVFEHVTDATTGSGMLVVSTVAHGYVQKWDAGSSSWRDISTKPSSSDPRELLQFLSQRVFVAGDRLQWVPAGGAEAAQVFDIVSQGTDTPPVVSPDVPLPAAVSSISVSASSEPGTLEIDWTAPASGDVTGYTVRIRSGEFTQTIDVAGTSATFTELAPLKPYAIDVWASNDSGNGPIETAFHTLLDIRTVGDQVTAWDIRRSLLPQEPTDPQGNLITPLATPWGDRLGFPGVSYEAIWAATPDAPAEVPVLSLPATALSSSLSGGQSVAMWVQATGPGVLLSSTVNDTNGNPVEVPYLWIDTDGNVNGGFYGSDDFDFNSGQTVLSYQTLTRATRIGSPLAITGQVTVIDNNWHHVALVADGDTQSLYIDGLLQGTAKPTVIQQETGLVSSLYGNTITINLEESPSLGETFTARLFQDDTYTFNVTSTGPLRSVTPLAVSATDVVTPGSSYTPVASATLLIPASGPAQLQIVMQDAVHAQNALSAMLLYGNAGGSSFQMLPTTSDLAIDIGGYEVGTSVFPASTGSVLPQVNYPQPFIGAIDDLSVWNTALPQASVQAAMTAPVNTAVNGVVLPSGATLAGIAPPSFALNFSNPDQVPDSEDGYTFTNTAPQGDASLVATSTLLTVGTPATIPASQFANDPAASNYLPRLGNYQNYGMGLMTPLDSGSIRVTRSAPYTAQVALAQSDVLTFALNGGQPTTVAITVTDEFGTVSSETISTGNPVSLGAAYTGTFKVTLNLPADSLFASVPVTFSQLPGSINRLQPLLSVYEQRLAAYTSFESAYADPTIPTNNPTSNFNGFDASLATGAADYFPLWSDTTYFPTSATTEAGQAAYAEQVSAAYEALVSANDGLSFANLNFQAVDGSRSIPEQNAVDLATAYRVAFGQEPPQLPIGATSFTPSANDSPSQAIYKFFSNVNRWRQQADTALRSLAASIASITPQSVPYEIAELIASNQAAFVSGQTDGIVSESSEEDLGNVAKESATDLGIKGAGKLFEMGIVHKAGKSIGVELGATGVGLGVEMCLKMFTGWIKIKGEAESPTSSVYVSFVPIINAMTEYDSLEDLAQSISVNSDAFARRIETQLTNPAYLQSIYSNFGLLKALAGVSGDGVEQLADSGALDDAAAEFSAHQAWSAMVPAAFSWEQVKPDEFPAANIQNTDDAYDWIEEPLQINSSNSSDPVAMATGDFNGDGYPDLVLSNTGGGDLSRQNLLVLYAIPNLNGNQESVGYTTGWSYDEATESSGNFTKVIDMEDGLKNPSGVAVADFNGDGNDDIVVNFTDSQAAIYLGSSEVSATGSLATPVLAGNEGINLNGGTHPEQVVVADFNNDGQMDFASACTDSSSIVVAMNTTKTTIESIGVKSSGNETKLGKTLTFTTFNVNLSGNLSSTLSGFLATGDLNGDGYADLAVTSSRRISFLLSDVSKTDNADGTTTSTWNGFSDSTSPSFPSTLYSNEIVIGDFDGDGKTGDIAFLGYSNGSVLPESMTGSEYGDQMVGSNNLIGSRVWAQGLWLIVDQTADYASSSSTVTPTWMGYGGIVGLATVPKALKYGSDVTVDDGTVGPDGLAYSYAVFPSDSNEVMNNPTAVSIAVVVNPLAAQKSFWDAPSIFNSSSNSGIWNGQGASYQLSFGELDLSGTNGVYSDVVVSPSGMIAASSGQGGNIEDKKWYSQVSWSNNVLANSPISTYLPDSGEELEYVTSTGDLPSGYNPDEFVLTAMAALEAGTPTFMPIQEYGLPSKVASPNFFLAAVSAMVQENGELADSSGKSIVGWNLVDNNGNPIALETASMLFGLTTPAITKNERGADEPLPAVLPQLWEPIDRVVEFANPYKPLKAYNGMWYADTKAANSAVTSLNNAFFLWGQNNASYHPDGVLTENALDLFKSLPLTDDDYTVTLGPIGLEPPTLQIPAPTNLQIAVADSGTTTTTTLTWNAPAFASGSPLLYSVRVFNGISGSLITSLDTTVTQAVFDNLLSPETSYYTVTATIPGASSVAGYAPWIESNPSLPAAVRDNVFVGIATEGIPFVGGGLSGTGLTYNYQDLSDSLGYRGIDFTLLGSNTPNMIASTGEVIPVDGTAVDGSSYNVIHLAAAAVGRDQENVEIIVTTTDGSTTTDYTWTQSFSDWKASAGFSGESIIASMDTAIANSGVAIPFETAGGAGAYNLYGYSWRVPAGQTVTSITLPDNQLLNVLDIKLAQVEQVQISSTDWSEWNAPGIGTFNQQPNSLGFDSDGQYYAGSELPAPLQWELGNGNAIQIDLGNPNSDTHNPVNNVLLVNDQLTIDLSSSSDAIVGVSLAAAYTENGGSQTATITPSFNDASSDSWEFQLYPWLYTGGEPGADAPPILSTIHEYVQQDGGHGSGTTYIYGYQYDSPSAAKITSLSLPANSGLGILGLTVETLAAESAGILVAAPLAPQALTLTNTSIPQFDGDDGSVTLSWDPPAYDGGEPVTSYTATMQVGDDVQTFETTSTSQLFDVYDTGVGNLPTTFTVTANSDAGSGMVAELAPATPSAPQGLAYTVSDTGQVTLSWEPPASDGGAPIAYYMLESSLFFERPIVASTSYTFDVTPPGELTAPIDVTVSVIAVNVAGTSDADTSHFVIAPPPPASAPQYLAAIPGPGAGQITLSWQPPATSVSPVTSYAVTTDQARSGTGPQTFTVTAVPGSSAALSYVLDNVEFFEGTPSPFSANGSLVVSVTANNALGSGLQAGLLIGSNFTTYPLDTVAYAANEQPFLGGGLDGNGNAFSFEAMATESTSYPGAGNRVENGLVWPMLQTAYNGENSGPLEFDGIFRDQPSVIVPAGQTISFPQYGWQYDLTTSNTLALAAVAVNGDQANQQFILNFADGTNATYDLDIIDWLTDPADVAGLNSDVWVVANQTYYNTASGGRVDESNSIFGYVVSLGGKTLQSVTLPSNSNVRIIGMKPFQQ